MQLIRKIQLEEEALNQSLRDNFGPTWDMRAEHLKKRLLAEGMRYQMEIGENKAA